MTPSTLQRKTGLSRTSALARSPIAKGEAPARRKRMNRESAHTKARRPARGKWSTLNPVSEKRAAEEVVYRRFVRVARKRAAGRCELQVNGDCLNDGDRAFKLDPHEPRTKARFGMPKSPDEIRMACRPCHDWTHDNTEEAEARGFLVPSWEGRAA